MPIYPYMCTVCGHTKETLCDVEERNEDVVCPECGEDMRRAMELQTVQTRPDIEPGYDVSLGEYVGSRKELREKLAYHNAYSPSLMQGSEPQPGRLTSEERDIAEGKSVRQPKTIFERRREPGWGKNPSIDAGQSDVIVSEGAADYSGIKDYIKERTVSAAQKRAAK